MGGSMFVVVTEADEIVVARLRAGDETALGELFDRYGPFVFGLARRVTGSRDLAEDVTQEVFTTLWRRPDRFDESRGSLRTFLGVMARRRAIDLVRSESRRTQRECRHQALEADDSSVGDEVDACAVGQVVRAAIATLPPDQRTAVELAYLAGHSQREVATLLGIPVGTAKSRLRLAHARLGKLLAPSVLDMA